MGDWKFYGRNEHLESLATIFRRGRWFFVKVTGRRRIGKTALIQHALKRSAPKRDVFYVQIPDSELPGAISAVTDALAAFAIPADRFPPPVDAAGLAKLFEAMAAAGYILVIDEFQCFHRKGYEEFCSHLQAAVDRLAAKAEQVHGGMVVLGSIHTEMSALLEDRHAPLFQRVTDDVDLGHLDIASILAILRDHADDSPERLLFLWTLFEGVPKFYRDCFEQNVLAASREALLRRIFFESSSPLRTEAENWFLRELRGRYDVILKLIARAPGRGHNELIQAIRDASGKPDTQIGGYIKVLLERYRLIERKLPVFAKPDAKRGRYYIADNFLRAWLGALAGPVSSIAFRPIDPLVREASERLEDVEGQGFEKLVGALHEERSRKGMAGFALTRRVQGYWDNANTEIDLVAVNEQDQVIRFGTCKRNAKRLLADIATFQGHVQRFLAMSPQYGGWKTELAAFSPALNKTQRATLKRQGVIAEDLRDLTRGM